MSSVVAKLDGFIGHNGVPIRVQVGEVYPDSDELVLAHPELFDPVTPPVVAARPKKRVEPLVVEGGKP